MNRWLLIVLLLVNLLGSGFGEAGPKGNSSDDDLDSDSNTTASSTMKPAGNDTNVTKGAGNVTKDDNVTKGDTAPKDPSNVTKEDNVTKDDNVTKEDKVTKEDNTTSNSAMCCEAMTRSCLACKGYSAEQIEQMLNDSVTKEPSNSTVNTSAKSTTAESSTEAPKVTEKPGVTTEAPRTTSIKTVQKQVTEIKGEMKVDLGGIEDPKAFAENKDVQDSFASSLGDSLGVPAEYVTVTLTVVESRLRRLAGTVSIKVEYTITIPEDAAAEVKSAEEVTNSLNSLSDDSGASAGSGLSLASLASAVSETLAKAVPDMKIEVAIKEIPKPTVQKDVTITVTEIVTMPPPSTTAASGNVSSTSTAANTTASTTNGESSSATNLKFFSLAILSLLSVM